MKTAESAFQLQYQVLMATVERDLFRRIVEEVAEFIIIVLSPSGEITEWNHGAEIAFGYTPLEAVGRHFSILFTPEDAAAGAPAAELERAARAGRADDRRWHLRRGGSRFFCDGVTTPLFDDQRKIVAFSKIARDATATRQAEDRAARLQAITEVAHRSLSLEHLFPELMERFCAAMHFDSAAVLLISDDGRSLTVRTAYGVEQEVNRGAIIPVGEGFAGRVAAENRAIAIEDMAHANIYNPVLRTAGLKSVLGVPLHSGERLIGVLHVGTVAQRAFSSEDIDLVQRAADRIAVAVTNARLYEAEHQARERASFLAEAGELLNSSLDYERVLRDIANLSVPVLADWCAVDIRTDGSLRRVAVTHRDPAKIQLAFDLQKRYPATPEDPSGIYHVLRTGEPELYEDISDDLLRTATIDDEHFGAAKELGLRSAMIVPLTVRDNTFGAISFVSAESGRQYTRDDLSFVRELARHAAVAVENAKLYREAREATHARDIFMATLSHEMRTPLTSVIGWVEMMRSANLDPATTKVALDSIEQSAKVQARLVDDLLDTSRIIAGKLRLELAPVDFREVIDEVLRSVQPLAEASGVHIVSEIESNQAVVLADSNRLHQIVWNLLTNAIKFTPKAGLVRVSVDREDGQARLTVCDTGRGIEPELLPHIFELFQQGEVTTRSKGLGLGLAIVRSLVERQGGAVEAQSEGRGKGATFIVRLPLASS